MITIFTPTYNRADKLLRVYSSLLAQSKNDFEWLIVDDGSVDMTESVVEKFDKTKFDIRYYKQKNGGKHRAYNRALKMARGEYFLCLDSDDWLVEQAVEEIIHFTNKKKENFILAYKENENRVRLSNRFPDGIEKINLFDLNHKFHCNGEFTIIFRTEYAKRFPFPVFQGENFITESVVYDRMASNEKVALLPKVIEFTIIFRTEYAKRFPFPVFQGENFITESVVYDRMASNEKVALLPKVITICEYQEEGLSNNLNYIMKENPAGYCLYFMQRIDLQKTLIQRMVMAGKYQCFGFLAGKQKSIYIGKYSIFVRQTKLLGFLFLLYYKTLRGF